MRATGVEQAERVNAAIALTSEHASVTAVVQALMRRFRISRRQAYRYVQRAQEVREPLQMPEQKVVFTVKLPRSLAERIRRLADCSGRTLSAVVAQALEAFLRSGRRHGPKRPTEAG